MSAGEGVRWNHRDVPQPARRLDCWGLEANLPAQIVAPPNMRRVRVSWDGASYSLHLSSASHLETPLTLTALSGEAAFEIPARVTNGAVTPLDGQRELELKKWCLEKALQHVIADPVRTLDIAQWMFDWLSTGRQPSPDDAS